jgi:DNA-binding NarL/FixJ family response regulator
MGVHDQRLNISVVAKPASLRDALRVVAESAGHHVSSTRASAPDTAQAPGTCDVVVIGGDLSRELPRARLAWPDARLLSVIIAPSSRAVTAALREGTTGVVEEQNLASRLPATLLAVACGQLCIPSEFASQAERQHLSMREKQVLGMVVLGFANLEIAQRLFVTESTVKSHLNSAFRKLGVRSRVEATNLILDPTNGLGTGILTIPTSNSEG